MINQKRLQTLTKALTETTAPIIISILQPIEDRWVVVYERDKTVRCAICDTRNGEIFVKSDLIVK